MENGRTRWKEHQWVAGTSNEGNLRSTKISYKFSATKFFNNRRPIDDDDYSGTASTNPAEQAYFHCWGYSNNSAVDPAGEAPEVDIEYLVVFHEPKMLQLSS